jgi:hypothetical protein
MADMLVNLSHIYRLPMDAVNTILNYKINYDKFRWPNGTRDLGIYIDNDPKFEQHISKMTHIGHIVARLKF